MHKSNLVAKIIDSEEEWGKLDRFVLESDLGNIHQCSDWGQFQVKSGLRERFWGVVVEETLVSERGVEKGMSGGQIVASAVVVKQRLPFGRCWLYVPRGPVWDFEGTRAEEILKKLLGKIEELAIKEKAVFLRIDPGLLPGEFDFSKDGFVDAHAHYQPENTIWLDLSKTEEEILAQMKPKGRYNIKLAEKKGVTVVEIDSFNKAEVQRGAAEFFKLLQETTSRDNFSGHDQKYYEKMLETLGDKAKMYLAEYEGKIIAGIIDTFFKDTGIYYFGASGNQYRNLMAPYLLQWKAILEAKKRGMKWYDFLGVAPSGAGPKHPWAGVTEFKEKFGGKRVDYLTAQEKIYDKPMFWLIRLAKYLKRLF